MPLLATIALVIAYNVASAELNLERVRRRSLYTFHFYALPILEYLLLSFPRMYKQFEGYENVVDIVFYASFMAMPIQFFQQRVLVTGEMKELNKKWIYVLFMLCLLSFNIVAWTQHR